nr:hypothetical protein [Pseudomonas chengduensis]
MNIEVDDSGVYEKSRRNVMIVSAVILVFGFLSPDIEKISLLGTEISTGGEHSRIWGVLFCLSAYMVFRLLHMIDFKLLVDNDQVQAIKERFVIAVTNIVERKAIEQRVLETACAELDHSDCKVKYSLDTKFEYEGRVGNPPRFLGLNYFRVLKRQLSFSADVHYVVTFSSGNVHGGVASLALMHPRRWVLHCGTFCSLLWGLLFLRWSSEYVQPLFVGCAAMIYAMYKVNPFQLMFS